MLQHEDIMLCENKPVTRGLVSLHFYEVHRAVQFIETQSSIAVTREVWGRIVQWTGV